MTQRTESWPLILVAAAMMTAMGIGAAAAVTLIPQAPPCQHRSDATWPA